MKDTSLLTQQVKALAREMGFNAVGIASAEDFSREESIVLERMGSGLMDGLPWYHKARVHRGTRPAELLPSARSIISLAVSYRTREPPGEDEMETGRVARYAWGRDYHDVIGAKLKALVRHLETLMPGLESKWWVDTGPMLDRAAAQRAGVGFYGKNTNLIVPGLGSWVFLAQVVTNLELEPDRPLKKSCGRCTACIPACPTGAIVAPYVIDNRRCISYLTIECRGPIPRELRPLIGDWVFGCDLCQEVCPINGDTARSSEASFYPEGYRHQRLDLVPLLELTEEEFRARFRKTAIWRATRVGLMRNACVALGNRRERSAVPALIKALASPEPLVRGHAAWALGRIGGQEAAQALREALEREQDEWVKGELLRSLEPM